MEGGAHREVETIAATEQKGKIETNFLDRRYFSESKRRSNIFPRN